MSESSFSILFPFQDRVAYRQLPEETWHDLGLDSIVEKVARQPAEGPLLQRVLCSLTADPAVARFRADVFDDLLRHPEIRDQLMSLLDQVKMFYDYSLSRQYRSGETIWDLMHRLEEYHDYVRTVEAIRSCLADQDLRAEGLIRLREKLEEIAESSGFDSLRQDVEALRLEASAVRSVTVGINVNDRFEAISMGLVSVNAKPFAQSGILKRFASAVSGRDHIQPEAEWNGSLSYEPASPGETLSARTESLMKTAGIMRNPLLGLTLASIPREDGSAETPRQMDAAASQLLTRLVRRLKDALGKYVNISVREIADLIPELLFYVRWAEYLESLRKAGWRFCKPEAREAAETSAGMDARGFYNLKLIGTAVPGEVVYNDLSFDAEKRVYILTGANRGGKTTVTQAVGQLFLLAQSGISVPAESFEFDPVDQVLTHFPADEDRTLDLGRLGEECKRFRELFVQSSDRSLMLLNETFSTTSFEEGYYIAVDAVRAILCRNLRAIYNTHMHKLAFELDTAVNRPEVTGKALSLVSVSTEGKASFRIRIAPPEGKSFAQGIAEKYGVTYEALTQATV